MDISKADLTDKMPKHQLMAVSKNETDVAYLTDTISSNDTFAFNNSFPKIENLEYFPLNVLLQVFGMVDDIGLFNLAETSSRFECIAKIVMYERYTHKYFFVDPSNSQHFENFFQRFGSVLKSIEAKDGIRQFKDKQKDWIKPFLDKAINLEKLKLDLIDMGTNEYLLQQHVNSSITHLNLRSVLRTKDKRFVLSKFRNLEHLKLEHNPTITFKTLKELIINNPKLESLYIGNEFNGYSFTYKHAVNILEAFPFDKLMVLIGTHLTRLKELAYVPCNCITNSTLNIPIRPQPVHIVDRFVASLQNLESLALSSMVIGAYTNVVELLYRLQMHCKNLKHLELHDIYGSHDEFIAIQSFNRIESLTLKFLNFESDNVVFLVENLPSLHHLCIRLCTHVSNWFYFTSNWLFVLPVLSKCPSLVKLTIATDILDFNFEIFSSTGFFNLFKDTVQTRNVSFEIACRGEIIGTITNNEVIWRNKLVHWVGHVPSKNLSSTNLLDLSKQLAKDAKNAETSPFNLILDYLDLNSIQSVSKTNRECAKLVRGYVKRHSQQQKPFILSDEFFYSSNFEYMKLNKFGKHVTNLRVNLVNGSKESINALRQTINKFPNLNKLYLHTEAYNQPADLIVPQVRHLIFDGGFFERYRDLRSLSHLCPDLSILELKQRNLYKVDNILLRAEPLKFRNLQKVEFSYHNNEQVQWLQDIFKGSNTKLSYFHTDY